MKHGVSVILVFALMLSAPGVAGAEAAEQRIDETVSVHFKEITLRDLIRRLAPKGWRVRFDVSPHKLSRRMTFHAETTRRDAFDELFLRLNMSGVFYPSARMLLVYERPAR